MSGSDASSIVLRNRGKLIYVVTRCSFKICFDDWQQQNITMIFCFRQGHDDISYLMNTHGRIIDVAYSYKT